jgi:dienelactone hydrolase
VAVLGQSMGGSAALYAIDRDLAAQYFDQRFRAAIAYYPGCGIPAANTDKPASGCAKYPSSLVGA